MKNRGFTLVEMVLYVGLFGILMSGMVLAAYQLLQSGDRNQIAVSIQEEGTFLTRKINWALSNADNASVDSTNALVIHRPDLISVNQEYIVISGDDNTGAMSLARGSGEAARLNSEAMPVKALSFTVDPAEGGRPAAVSTAFQILGKPFVFKRFLRQ